MAAESVLPATVELRLSRDSYLRRLGARRLVVTDRDGVRASEELRTFRFLHGQI